VNFITNENKIEATLNSAKTNLEKTSKMAEQLGIFAGDIDRMRNQSLVELQKILLKRK
jgi:hypothetical protein